MQRLRNVGCDEGRLDHRLSGRLKCCEGRLDCYMEGCVVGYDEGCLEDFSKPMEQYQKQQRQQQ